MGWFVRERRGALSWRDRTLGSISAPPLPLIVFFMLFATLTLLEMYSEFQRKMERCKAKIRFGLMMLPLLGILVVSVMLLPGSLWCHTVRRAVGDGGDSPWGLLLLLGLVIVMGYYHSSFQSVLFRHI